MQVGHQHCSGLLHPNNSLWSSCAQQLSIRNILTVKTLDGFNFGEKIMSKFFCDLKILLFDFFSL